MASHPFQATRASLSDAIDIADYMVEVRATENSRSWASSSETWRSPSGKMWRSWGLFTGKGATAPPSSYQIIDVGDVFIVEVAPEDLRTFLTQTGFALEIFRDLRSDVVQTVESEDVTLLEAVVMRNGVADGNTVRDIHMHPAFGVNLLGISRRGNRLVTGSASWCCKWAMCC